MWFSGELERQQVVRNQTNKNGTQLDIHAGPSSASGTHTYTHTHIHTHSYTKIRLFFMSCVFVWLAGDDFYEKTGSNTVEVCISISWCERSANYVPILCACIYSVLKNFGPLGKVWFWIISA